ncbi:MAG: hypothetical protein AAF252_05390 [Pseudomonadota bacterium]
MTNVPLLQRQYTTVEQGDEDMRFNWFARFPVATNMPVGEDAI